VIDDHGGDVSFWLAWIYDKLDSAVKPWLRQQGAKDTALRRDLASVEQPAQELVQVALESQAYLAAIDPPGIPDDSTFTDATAGDRATEEGQGSARRKLRPALFALLEAVAIPAPTGDQVSEGSQLLTALVGPEALAHFRRLDATVQLIRRRGEEEWPAALYRVLKDLVPDLFDRARFRPRLSYRLYLRARLMRYCRRRGWRPAGPTFPDLATAFPSLSRRRIGQIIQQLEEAEETDWPALTDGVRGQWRAGLQLAAVEFDD
jgi:hypothetical protein